MLFYVCLTLKKSHRFYLLPVPKSLFRIQKIHIENDSISDQRLILKFINTQGAHLKNCVCVRKTLQNQCIIAIINFYCYLQSILK